MTSTNSPYDHSDVDTLKAAFILAIPIHLHHCNHCGKKQPLTMKYKPLRKKASKEDKS